MWCVVLLLSAAVVWTGHAYYNSVKIGILHNKMYELSSVADLRVAQIERWRGECLRDAIALMSDPAMARRMRALACGKASPADIYESTIWLKALAAAYQYKAASVCDSDGRVIVHTGQRGDLIGIHAKNIAEDAMRSNQPMISDVHIADDIGQSSFPHLDLVVPIPKKTPGGRSYGYVFFRIDPSIYLFELLRKWPTTSKTSEVVIVRRENKDIVNVNDLGIGGSALSIRSPITSNARLTAVKAVSGYSGFYEGVDYRGRDVISAIRTVPSFSWGLIAKVDTKEAMAPLVRVKWEIAAISALLCVMIFVIAVFIRRREQLKHLRAIVRSEADRLKTLGRLEQTTHFLTEAQRMASIGWYVFDAIGHKWEDSETLDEIFGIKGQEIPKTTSGWLSLIHPDDRDIMEHYFIDNVLGKSLPFDMEYRIVRQNDGVIRWVHGRGGLVFENGKVVKMIGIIQDITQRKETEANLFESERRYRRLFETAKDGILLLNAETGQIEDVNPFITELLGYTADEILDKSIWDIGFLRDVIGNKENFVELQKQGYIRYEDLPLETKSGKRIEVEFVSNLYRVNGHSVIQCNIRDITDRKITEHALEESESELRRARNLETIGMLSAGLAHEVRNPLFAISTLVAALAKRAPDIPDIGEFMTHIKDQTGRLNRIMSDLLVLGRPLEPEEFVEADLGKIIRRTLLQMEAAQEKTGKRCIVGLPEKAIKLMCSPDKIQQIFLNLLSNAIYFSTPDASIAIDVSTKADKVIIRVVDDGEGIHPDLAGRLCEPFQSRREGGTGLGLAIVRKLAADHGGTIEGKNRTGVRGAEFTLTLPIFKV